MLSENIYTYVELVLTRYHNDFLILPTRLYIKRITSPDGNRTVYYFGKYTGKNIFSYRGSGNKWKSYIKKWGSERIDTLWVSDWYTDTYEILRAALTFSIENDIIKSDKWANLIFETGLASKERKPLKEIVCPICNKTFYIEQCETKGCCSVSCAAKLRFQTHGPKNISTKIYKFKQISLQEEILCTAYEFKNISGLTSQEVNHLISMNVKTYGDWTIWDESLNMFRDSIPRAKYKRSIKYECVHCKKLVDTTNLKRWHNNNCKLKNATPL